MGFAEKKAKLVKQWVESETEWVKCTFVISLEASINDLLSY